jgi:pimeloyl-ACP methyl ester carboxylesterase
VKIVPHDPGDTWWFGFSEDFDYRKPTATCPVVVCAEAGGTYPPQPPYLDIPASGDIVNYTEARVLRMVFDLLRNPPFQRTLDFDRVYVEGSSMGGSGALQFALRYPNVFAAAAAGKSMTDYGDYMIMPPPPAPESDLRHELPRRWGAYPDLAGSSGLPLLGVRTTGPGKWAEHLAPFDGTVVWDWMDHIYQITSGTGHALDNAPFGVNAGFQDDIIPYPHQGEPFFSAFGNLGRSWGGKIGCGGHGGPSHAGMPPSLTASATNPVPGPFSDYNVRRVETIPGFVALTAAHYPTPPTTCCNSCQPTPGPYYYFHDLIWSSSWYGWDQPPVDTPEQWEMSIKWTGSFAPPPTVDIVPRRLTFFDVEPGALYSWMNVEIGTGTVVQPASAPITPGAFTGLLRLVGIQLTPPGNRIILVKLP